MLRWVVYVLFVKSASGVDDAVLFVQVWVMPWWVMPGNWGSCSVACLKT